MWSRHVKQSLPILFLFESCKGDFIIFNVLGLPLGHLGSFLLLLLLSTLTITLIVGLAGEVIIPLFRLQRANGIKVQATNIINL